ncbi:hypothetical protein HWV62_28638 [Athelia sp. TMB]|nr:hypothetical protein HWV62_28638 [Athelia sp. TMB]
MKALFHRINRGFAKERDQEIVSSQNKDQNPVTPPKEKPLQLPPLPEWPPQSTRVTSTPTSISSFKPLPDIATSQPTTYSEETSQPPVSVKPTTNNTSRAAEPSVRSQDSNATFNIATRTPSHRTEPDAIVRTPSRKTQNGSIDTTTAIDQHKKVAFISPPLTPAAEEQATPNTSGSTATKTTVSRFQAAHGKEPRGSTSTPPTMSASKTDLGSTKATVVSNRATSTRTATSPYPGSVRSDTPYSSMSNTSSRILAAASWSEGAEEDLVSNLGPRERTRQEVLWEIVASEERYVGELVKMKDTFIEPLLHPYSSNTASPSLEYDEYPSSRYESPLESNDQLPIASRFMSPLGFRPETPSSPVAGKHEKDKQSQTPNIDGESLGTDEETEGGDHVGKDMHSRNGHSSKHDHPRSPYRSTATKTPVGGKTVPFPSSRSHQSLPPPPRVTATTSTHSLSRQSSFTERERARNNSSGNSTLAERKGTPAQSSKVLKKFRKSQIAPDVLPNGAVAAHQLPEDLRVCLEVVESGILDGHIKLSDGLRKRYEEQYPLVRSLADVFVSNSHIFQGYATYVLHLERALEQVDNALSTVAASKKPKNQDSADWLKICKYLQRLEQTAADKGETGLAITLSKPFQRLLKYPLLFQNLLFHTDPSTFEYESTLQMVAEVETIVRSIEDEKIQKEDRDKTRDVFARIEGLDKVKQLAVPKPSRLLIEERQIMGLTSLHSNGSPSMSTPPPVVNSKGVVKGKTSFKRLSDVLNSGTGIGGKKDLWHVVFNDVVLQCQRTGTTSLPLVAATNSRTTSLPDLQGSGKAKYATTGRRNTHTKPRNLYKFLKIETWVIGDVVQPREGVVSMEDRRTQGTPTSRRPPAAEDAQSSRVTVTRPEWNANSRSPLPPPGTGKRTRNNSQTSTATRTPITKPPTGSPALSEDSGVGLYRQMMSQDPTLNR